MLCSVIILYNVINVVWCDEIVRCDIKWYDVMWCVTMWCGVMWYDVMWCGLLWYEILSKYMYIIDEVYSFYHYFIFHKYI